MVNMRTRAARSLGPERPPNASIIYGGAAAILFVVSLFFMFFKHRWGAGFLVLLPASALLGFALHFLKYNR